MRAAFAVAFVMLSAFQPGLFAEAGIAGMHGEVLQVEAAESHDHAGGHDHAADAAPADHHGKVSDKSCEVHCAPAHALPVECPLLTLPRANGHRSPEQKALLDGFNVEFIKPPRT